jgi:hypothetical protein
MNAQEAKAHVTSLLEQEKFKEAFDFGNEYRNQCRQTKALEDYKDFNDWWSPQENGCIRKIGAKRLERLKKWLTGK